ncbi:hypothetical protein [Dysgonomonas sp. PH5-37]|uniref:hypothetical protein n=1 Tax=Dysgonomonas sp. PH5-37 TaxID=2940648 RepID=UPI002474C348|nr:hypothetical protein [Dysgonomonas sp. PH5-37]
MKFLFILFLIPLSFASCGDEEPLYTIPAAEINFKVDIRLRDKELSGAYGYKIFPKVLLASDRLSPSGIIVRNTGMFYENTDIWILEAFDRCCPYEDDWSVTVSTADGLTARCPKCKTVYDITYGGRPKEGVGKQRLQPYNVYAQQGNTGIYFVSNPK